MSNHLLPAKPKSALFNSEPFERIFGQDCRIIFNKWLVTDGEYVEINQPILQVIKITHQKTAYSLSNAISEGILSHSTLMEGDSIANGALLFNIYEVGAYEKENRIENETHYFYLNEYKIDKITKRIEDRKRTIVPDFYLIKREKIDGSFVSEDELVITLSCLKESIEIPIKATRDGFINFFFRNNSLQSFREDYLLFTISNSDETRVNQKYFSIPDLKIDEFSNQKIIKWNNIGGGDRFITSKDHSGTISLGLAFHYDNGDFIVFRFTNKNLPLSKGDKVSFLFDNGLIKDFTLTQNSYRSPDYAEKIFENRVVITDDELLIFAEENLKYWKIKFDKSGREIIGGISGYGEYQDPANLKIVVKKHAAEYRSIVRKEITGYAPILKSTESQVVETIIDDSDCYVYLMTDTVNNVHKIGISNNPAWRERTLQSEKPTIELLVAKKFINRKIASSFEKALHDAYSSKRLRGEWFKLDINELDEILKTLSS